MEPSFARSLRILAAVGSTLVLAACVGPPQLEKSPRVDSFDLLGEMTLRGKTSGVASNCRGAGGYKDILEGAGVTVYDAMGKIVGSGRLEQGAEANHGGCMFPIVVPAVPGGSAFYQVEVSHRGKITVSEAEARSGQLSMVLGD